MAARELFACLDNYLLEPVKGPAMTTPTGSQVARCSDRRQLSRWRAAAIARGERHVVFVIDLQLAMMKGRRHA
jgi:hypothetical protein